MKLKKGLDDLFVLGVDSVRCDHWWKIPWKLNHETKPEKSIINMFHILTYIDVLVDYARTVFIYVIWTLYRTPGGKTGDKIVVVCSKWIALLSFSYIIIKSNLVEVIVISVPFLGNTWPDCWEVSDEHSRSPSTLLWKIFLHVILVNSSIVLNCLVGNNYLFFRSLNNPQSGIIRFSICELLCPTSYTKEIKLFLDLSSFLYT